LLVFLLPHRKRYLRAEIRGIYDKGRLGHAGFFKAQRASKAFYFDKENPTLWTGILTVPSVS
jgi:hypothetical protein